MRIGWLLLLLASLTGLAWSQGTPIRSVTSLPATCTGGTPGISSEIVVLITGGVGLQYTCTAPNTWSATGSVSVNGAVTPGDCVKFVSSSQIQDAGFVCPAPSAVPTQVVQSGLLAEYRILPTETAGAIVDYSGNGNSATGTVGTAPSIIAVSGGLNFTGNGAVSLPAALNGAKTMQFIAAFQYSGSGQYNALVAGGPGGPSTCTQFFLDNQHNNINAGTNYQFETWTTNFNSSFPITLQGSALVTLEIATGTADILEINNGLQFTNNNTGALSSGNYQLGGFAGGGGSCPSVSTYYTGQIYYAVFYNRDLTAQEIAQNSQFLQAVTTARGIPFALQSTSTTDLSILDGDSEFGFVLNSYMVFPTPLNVYNLSKSGATIEQVTSWAPFAVDPFFQVAAGRESVLLWAGTNDEAGSATTTLNYMASYCRARHLRGFACGVMSMMDRTASDAFKNLFNAAIRQYWPTFADWFVDSAADPNLGCDGCSANATYLTAGLHPTIGSATNILAPYIQRGFNRYYGNRDWSTATTYSSTAPAATAITAATESGNTVTITSTLNPPVGSCVTVAGVTPTGYNNVSGECWNVLTTSSTNFTYYNWTSGLGNGTIFGTAAVPLQKDADVFAILGGTAAALNFTLEPCGGYTDQKISLKNTNTNAWTVTAFGNDLIDGFASVLVPGNSIATLQVKLATPSTPVCSWVTTITNLGSLQNCSSSAAPAVCGSAQSGSVVVAAAGTTVTVNTTAVTANSQINLSTDDTLGTKLGVTCNSTLATLIGGVAVTARSAGVSFQITSGVTPAVNPLCINFTIVN